ncbi:nucleotide exchange factor GrpE [Rhodococcus rhodnii]|uniref:Protein GrpE n=2 Tax=Rhodococcus rhodnii TaxID=38312 RepID=R7WMM9_9NOCA|nr:nucleotide exchange factor GrpE [Rhodococcus rhodnii]EOM76576.1 heat shock protein [Rhodococcus rhodnii LMG 5362]TXG92181.1 nucleotide exchange factor GrpE [Rhodococcus rhodnii]
MTSDRSENEPVSFVDKRKIDPETGEVREPAGHDARPGPGSDDAGTQQDQQDQQANQVDAELNDEDTGPVHEAEVIAEEAADSPEAVELAERTADLQRLQAEYANYRRRTDKEKVEQAARGKAAVAEQLLPVLDDLDRAKAHGDLEDGPMKAIADKLRTTLTGLGLAEFGEEGDAFDPELHEAVQNEGDGGDPVLGTVLRKGYRFGDRVLRHAMVAVTDRPDSGGATATGETK